MRGSRTVLNITHKRNGYFLSRVITEEKRLPLACLADAHAGHKNFSEEHFLEAVYWIKNTGAAWFGCGDLIECSTKTSVGAGWAEQVMTPQEQIMYMSEHLKPIASQCMGLLNGNHEDRAYKTAGINPTEIIAYNIGAQYAGDELFCILGADKSITGKGKTYTLYACHTKKSNKTVGLAFNGMEALERWLDVDIICKGHGHDMGLSPPNVSYKVDQRNMAVATVERYKWLVGHYLRRPDSYIAKASGRPKPIGTIALWLDMDPEKPKRVSGEYVR
jgi:hypothetical protein